MKATQKINNGGSAFPKNNQADGMSLRTWLAGQALAGRCFSSNPTDSEKAQAKEIATHVYRVADAVIDLREPGNNDVNSELLASLEQVTEWMRTHADPCKAGAHEMLIRAVDAIKAAGGTIR